jgi:creatinine amidohydrolase
MHAGEIETSILLHAHPELGRPSLATAEKGKALLASLVDSFAPVLEILQRG